VQEFKIPAWERCRLERKSTSHWTASLMYPASLPLFFEIADARPETGKENFNE